MSSKFRFLHTLFGIAGVAGAQSPASIEGPSVVDPLALMAVPPIFRPLAADVGRMHILPPVASMSHLVTSVRDFPPAPMGWDLTIGQWNCIAQGYLPTTCPGDPMAALNSAADEWSPTLDPSGLHVVYQRGLGAPVLLCANRLTTAACFLAPVPVTLVGIGPGLLRDPQFGFTRLGLTLFYRRTLGGVDTLEGARYAIGTCTLSGPPCVIATAAPGRELYGPTPMNDNIGTTRCLVFNERGANDTAPHLLQFTSGIEGNTPVHTLLTSPNGNAFESCDANCGTLTFVRRALPLAPIGWRYVYRMGICALSSLTVPSPGNGAVTLFGPERCSGQPFIGAVMFGPLNGFSLCPGVPFTGCLGIDPLATALAPLNRCSSVNVPIQVPAGYTGTPFMHMQGLIFTITPFELWFSNTAHLWLGVPCF